jgi:tetratricopeptide (TPR) repeat protein
LPSQNNNSQKPEGSFAKETRKTLETCAKIDQAEDDLRDTRIFHSGAMDLETHLRLAFRRFTDQEYLQALKLANQVIIKDPLNRTALNLRALIYRKLGRLKDALKDLERAVAIDPGNAESLCNLGLILIDLRDFDSARNILQKSIDIDAKLYLSWLNLSLAQKELMELTKSRVSLNRALQLNPDSVAAKWNDALLSLLMGDLKEGFKKYLVRWNTPELKEIRDYEKGVSTWWDGEVSLSGKTILVLSEQGIGDSIQFSRLLKNLRSKGAKVVFEVQRAIASLMTSNSVADICISRGDLRPPYDFVTSLIDLPALLNIDESNIPPPTEIAAKGSVSPPLSTQVIQKLLRAENRSKVAICWKGNPRHKEDAKRSLPLDRFLRRCNESLLLVSVQVGSLTQHERDLLSAHDILDAGQFIENFADTALVLSQVNLVVTVDTSVAHLAASMKKPVMLILPFCPDWRWQSEGDASPWYPTIRIYRQSNKNYWLNTIDRLYDDLTSHFLLPKQLTFSKHPNPTSSCEASLQVPSAGEELKDQSALKRLANGRWVTTNSSIVSIHDQHPMALLESFRNLSKPQTLQKQTPIHLVYFINCKLSKKYGELFKAQFTDIVRSGFTTESPLHTPKLYVVALGALEDMDNINYIISTVIDSVRLAEFNWGNMNVEIYDEDSFEFRGIERCWRIAHETAHSSDESIIVYCHGKGISQLDMCNKSRTPEEEILFNQIVSNWRRNLHLLNSFPLLFKIGLCTGQGGWCWFNFWWARSSYIKTLERPFVTTRRHYYEDWLGRCLRWPEGLWSERNSVENQSPYLNSANLNLSLIAVPNCGIYNIGPPVDATVAFSLLSELCVKQTSSM